MTWLISKAIVEGFIKNMGTTVYKKNNNPTFGFGL